MDWLVFDMRTREQVGTVQADTRDAAEVLARELVGKDREPMVKYPIPPKPERKEKLELTEEQVKEAVSFWAIHAKGFTTEPQVKFVFTTADSEGEHDRLTAEVSEAPDPYEIEEEDGGEAEAEPENNAGTP